MEELLFKVIIIGDATVGKTSFVQRYVSNTFRRDYKQTIGVDFALKLVEYSKDCHVKLQLWDIAGQDRFTSMTRVYYKEAAGVFIVFDLTNYDSFKNVEKWKNDLDSKCLDQYGAKIPCVLLANKSDLPQRKVTKDEIENFANQLDFNEWIEISVKDNLMIQESANHLVEAMINRYKQVQSDDENPDSVSNQVVNLSALPVKKEKKCCSILF